MKILVYTDVHANIEALKLLQQTEDYQTSDMKIFLGDAVVRCPYPNECLDMIFASNDIFLLGNYDYCFANGISKYDKPSFNGEKKEHFYYMLKKVSKSNIEKLKSLPIGYSIKISGVSFYFTHFAWRKVRSITPNPEGFNPPSEKTAKLFKGIKSDYVIFGHNHKPSDLIYNNTHFICVGSLGMEYPGNYLVIEVDKNGNVKTERKQIYFDINKLKKEMLKQNYPGSMYCYNWFKNNQKQKK